MRKVVLYIVQEVVQPPPDLLTQALHFCRLTASLAHSLVQIHHLPINSEEEKKCKIFYTLTI
jgi:hypothetical protein